MKRMRAVGLAAAWLGVGAMALAQNPPKRSLDGAPGVAKRPMTFADLMAMKRVSDPQISPSGRWVLFTVMDVDLEKNTKTNHLWVVPLNPSEQSSPGAPNTSADGVTEANSSAAAPLRNDKTNAGVPRLDASRLARDDGSLGNERQVTSGAGESFGRFSPDGRWVSWTQEAGKDETFARIAVAAWDEKTGTAGAAKALTSISGDADGAVWSPDSRRLMFTTEVWPECSVNGGASREADSSASLRNDKTNTGILAYGQNDAAIEISGTNNVAAWKAMQPAAWAEEDACDRAKDEQAEKNPVKAQVWDGLLYRHWDHWTGVKRTHIMVADLALPTHDDKAVVNGPPEKINAGVPRLASLARDDGEGGGTNPPKQSLDGAPAVTAIRDVTTARDVGDAETPTWMLGGPQEYAWAPDGKEIAYVTNLDPVPAASTNNDVFTLRVDEADARPVKVSTSAGSDDEPEYSPDGKWLAFRSQRQAGFESDRERLMLYERGSKTTEELSTTYSEDWVDEFVWSPDSKYIFSASGRHGVEAIYRSAVNPTLNRIRELEDEPRIMRISGLSEFSNLVISPNGGRVVSVGTRIERPAELYSFGSSALCLDPFGDEVPSLQDLTEADNHCEGTGPDFAWIEPAKALTHLNDSLVSRLDLSPLEPFWFMGAEGTKVEGFLLKPPGFDAKKKYPVKFLMHGGPQTAQGDAWSYRWNWELMAASGYVVIGINRRGSTGYGQKFVDEVSGDWGGRAYEDLMKGLDYAEANFPFIDKTRECALGASYGGYMADWMLTHTNRFKCIVTHDGLYDVAAAYGTTEEMWFPEWEFRRPEDFPKGWDGFSGGYDPMGRLSGREADSSASDSRRTLRNDKRLKTTTRILRSAQDDGKKQRRSPSGMTNKGESGDGHAAEPWRYAGLPANEDPFRRWSPKEYIQNAKTPTLVIHSQKDYRLDVSQGFALYTALQRQGVPSRFLYFPDEGHWVLKPKNSELWNAVVSDWCDRWTHSGKYAAP